MKTEESNTWMKAAEESARLKKKLPYRRCKSPLVKQRTEQKPDK